MKHHETFDSVIEKLQTRQIGRKEATQLLNSLKKQAGKLQDTFSGKSGIQTGLVTKTTAFEQKPRRSPATDMDTGVAAGSIYSQVAVVGMSGQFPDAGDVDTFWKNLVDGHDSICSLPPSYLDDTNAQPVTGGFLKDRDCFDPLFFNISPLEAESMNPHQRLILQESWKGLEHAGLNPKHLSKTKVGVFIGAEPTGYVHESFTGASDAIIASRLSYYLNLKGPALVVNTGCSSSGVAIHLACESLRSQESSIAIAGGVFAAMNQSGLNVLSDIGMCAEKGRCRTFDRSADGTAFSEGVGVVVLKRLDEALEQGDTIHGVILGSGMNQDGTSNGITAPNGVSQEALITDVYHRFSIHPEDIGYIEAHGTGTQLGDTVEANALVRAFKQFTDKKEYCRVGSAKAHIGHTSASAGVIGLIKALLSIKHRMIPGLLHFKKLNPSIGFLDSAFYVNKASEVWESDKGTPLTAALNSFGHSGTNVHLVVAEHIPAKQTEAPDLEDPGLLLVPLSAKTGNSLTDYAKRLLNFLESERIRDSKASPKGNPFRVNPVNMAYTLQTGREAMSHRLIFLVAGLLELEDGLRAFIDKEEKIHNCFYGQVDEYGDEPLLRDDKAASNPAQWIKKGDFAKVAKFWVKGVEPDWNLLYHTVKPGRIALPTYPFAKERYWARTGKKDLNPHKTEHGSPLIILEPLSDDRNGSPFKQIFQVKFNEQAFFFTHHKVRDQAVLPGVVYLEIACMALEAFDPLARIFTEQAPQILRLEQVFWVRPVTDIQNTNIYIRVQNQAQLNNPAKTNDRVSNTMSFEMYSLQGKGDEIIHCQGKASIIPAGQPEHLDMQGLKAKINQAELNPEQCYESLRSVGVDHGPSLKAVRTIHIGDRQVLAKLAVPSPVLDTGSQFVLHPSIMDAALQSCLGLLSSRGQMPSLTPSMPFALDKIEVLSPCTTEMSAWIRSTGSNKPDANVRKLDIDLCDDQGRIFVKMKGFSSRSLDKKKQVSIQDEQSDFPLKDSEELLLTPVWNPISPGDLVFNKDLSDAVLILGASKAQQKAVKDIYPGAGFISVNPEDMVQTIANKIKAGKRAEHIVWIAPEAGKDNAWAKQIIDRQSQGIVLLYRIIKALLKLNRGKTDLVLTLITTLTQQIGTIGTKEGNLVDPTHAGVHGLAGSLAKEYPHWNVRLFDLESFLDWPLKSVFTLAGNRAGNALVRRNREWYCQELIQVGKDIEEGPLPYRSGGVYVVIGGAGGIGVVWSQYMIEHYQARIIWIGRRKKDEKIQGKIDELAAKGPAPLYFRADATNFNALEKAAKKIRKAYPKIHGVVHSAIVLKDQSLANMDEKTFRAGLSAKLDTSVHMAEIFGNTSLDFMLFFSSIVSFGKAPGQSNYSAGSTFKDAFAQKLAQKGGFQVKIMNWGYWGSVGIVSSKDYKKRLHGFGLASIESKEGMAALNRLFKSPIDQMALVKTVGGTDLAGFKTMERITVYGDKIPSCTDELKLLFSKQIPEPPCRKKDDDRHFRKMEELVCGLLLCQLRAMGLFTKDRFTISHMKKRTQWIDLYDTWFEESMAFLLRAGYVTAKDYDDENTSYSMADLSGPTADRAWKAWEKHKKTWLKDKDLKAQTRLAEKMIKALPEILTGKVQATEVMFPDASLEYVKKIYQGNPVTDYFNDVLGTIVTGYFQNRAKKDPGARLKIFEIGAGTGGTTARVLPGLKVFGDIVETYTYTDISQAFLIHAQQEFAKDHPYLETAVFDVEKPPGEQNIPEDAYDIVIAVNVLHATKDIRETLQNAKACLVKNGLLILNEMSMNPLSGHLTFGLLKGWWRPQDRHLRIAGSPALSPEMWKNVLESVGYCPILFPVAKAHDLGHQIIVAQSNGLVRQKDTLGRDSNRDDAKKDQPTFIVEGTEPGFKAATKDMLQKTVQAFLINMVAKTLKISPERIKPSHPFEKYGIDSILVVQLTNSLNKVLDNISSTLFFEYQTINALADHLISTRKGALMKALGLENKGFALKAPQAGPRTENSVSPVSSARVFRSSHPMKAKGQGRFDVAIIGLAGQYPKARTLAEFWENLKQGKNCISQIPKDRWDWRKYFHGQKGKLDAIYTKWGGFLDRIDTFDPLFFQISPREAELMDPQERIFCETVYHSIEDAGYTPYTLGGSDPSYCRKVSVFAGVMNSTYTRASAHASIANRVSYLFDFQGPSMAVDTACSSSLSCIHLALESLYNNTSDCAIAGGVNLIVDPVHYLRLSAMNVLSTGDRCRAFGAGADGIVDGEGVGAIVLKPLENAILDQDHIYGIIKGSMVNAGGKTNGYTVPNPMAQSRLISDALERSGVDAGTISYVEAHGTGTILGDPIEIAGLTKAFSKVTRKKQFCQIGSVKSNIGHCESAAGMAGLTKILLQIKHGMLVPSLHSAKPNPNIDFSQTPFVVNQELCPWKPVKINGKQYPRRAGLSSFGAGGSNAHLIIEEYIPANARIHHVTPDIEHTYDTPALVVLSARTEDRLKVCARDLAGYLKTINDGKSRVSLEDMAYTLQTGRVAREYRMGMMVLSIDELIEKLEAFLEPSPDQLKTTDIYQGLANPDDDTLAVFQEDNAIEQALEKWVQQGQLTKLLSLWIKGLVFDWHILYKSGKTPAKVSLPVYPFEKKRYWHPDRGDRSVLQDIGLAPLLSRVHPLVHENISTLQAQAFKTVFTGHEFFLDHHRVKEQKVLPAVAYLEMARAAAEESIKDMGNQGIHVQAFHARDDKSLGAPMVTGLKNVVWVRPLILDHASKIACTRLFLDENNSGDSQIFRYEIHGQAGNKPGQTLLHSQGKIVLGQKQESPFLDLEQLKAVINQESLTPDQCYEGYKAMGIEYGTGHQSISLLKTGKNQVLAKLVLPSCVADSMDHFILHPAMMDAALQAAIGLAVNGKKNVDATAQEQQLKPSLPFALDEIKIFETCTDTMWAWIRYSQDSSPGDRIKKIDIDLSNKDGQIAVRMKKVSSRMLDRELDPLSDNYYRSGRSLQMPVNNLNLMSPVWQPVYYPEKSLISPDSGSNVLVVGGSRKEHESIQKTYPHAVFLNLDDAEPFFRDGSNQDRDNRDIENKDKDAAARLTRQFNEIFDGQKQGTKRLDQIVWIAPGTRLSSVADPALVHGQDKGVVRLFAMVKALLSMGYGVRNLAWTLVTRQCVSVRDNDFLEPVHAGIHGFSRSLSAEYPHWQIRVADLGQGEKWPEETIFTLPFESEGLAFRDREWFRQELVPVQDFKGGKSLYRKKGVYVVIGGAGGIGAEWSRYMIQKYQAKIIWIGRREKTDQIKANLESFSTLGSTPEYIRADASDFNAMENALEKIRKNHPQIHGIVHSAIVLADKSLAKMDEARFQTALSAKVDTCAGIARAFQNHTLDFVLFFSSMLSFEKSPGQSNYAAGCTFKDAFAKRLKTEWDCTVKIMNWGYWGSVGVVKGKEKKRQMAAFGMGSIEPEEGMQALETLMKSPLDQMTLMKSVQIKSSVPATGKWIAGYGDSIPACLDRLSEELPAKDTHKDFVASMKNSGRVDLETIILGLLGGSLRSLGIQEGPFSSESDIDNEITGFYRPWCETSLSFLREKKVPALENKSMSRDKIGYETDSKIQDQIQDMNRLWQEWNQLKPGWTKDENAHLTLVEACLKVLPDILTRKVQATDILFPDSAMDRVEGIYKDNALADLFNDILGTMVSTYVKERIAMDDTARIRILEIGAGTGGTTAPLLERLHPFGEHIKEYCYTDVSRAFLFHAQDHYSQDHAYLTTNIFNVENPIKEQGIQEGHYDLVIAANVLHTTKNIRKTLQNAKAALKKNGVLVLNELCANSLAGHLTFGLLEGWWRYEDHALRIPGCPGLSPDTWARVLAGEGFDQVRFPGAWSRDLGQQIILAQSNGIVVQAQGQPEQEIQGTKKSGEFLETSDKEADPFLEEVYESSGDAQKSLQEKTIAWLKNKLAETLKMPAYEIDASKPMEAYGMDSILAVHLTNTLHQYFEDISTTLFFEVQTIDALAQYLINTHEEVLLLKLGTPRLKKGEITVSRECLAKDHVSVPVKPGFKSPAGILNPAKEASKPGPRDYQVRDVAIIGLSGRYPLSENLDEFWNNLKQGKNCITQIPEDRWDWKQNFNEKRGEKGHSYTRWGGFIKDVDKFDPLFFHISPRDAALTDPQERLFLEMAYAGIEDAGYTPKTLSKSRRIGVFVGVMNSMYSQRPSYWSIANRVSHTLDFQGPSMAVDTACSSSLSAIHLALESLYCGSSNCAVAGGVNLILSPNHYLLLSAMSMVSSSNQNRSFGANADGFVDGEGVGVVVLKPLEQAVADKDHIYGIIKGSMINAGGKTNGYTVPNPNAQFTLIADTLEKAGVHPGTISYLEAHGTATVLGDPIEINGLTRAFEAAARDKKQGLPKKKQYCAMGSVKSNIGHCESAAGIAGITKVLLQMKHGMLVPSLHSETLNPDINFEQTPFKVQQHLEEWKRPFLKSGPKTIEYPRIAGISSFGAGGTNVHIILEEYIPGDSKADDSIPQNSQGLKTRDKDVFLVVFSAQNKAGLKRVGQNLLKFLEENESAKRIQMRDLAYTLQVGREPLEARMGLMVKSKTELKDKLVGFLDGSKDLENFFQGQVKENKKALDVFSNDRDMTRLVNTWMKTGRYKKLLELWVKGLNLDWNRLYGESIPCRISLPTYPFERERHWLDQGIEKKFLVQDTKATTKETGWKAKWDGATYVPVWEPAPEKEADSRTDVTGTSVMVSCDKSFRFDENLVARYQQNHSGTRLVKIHFGDATQKLSDDEWCCGKDDVKGFEKCLEQVGSIGCIYFISMYEGGEKGYSSQEIAGSQKRNEIQLLRLVKTLRKIRTQGKAPIKNKEKSSIKSVMPPIDFYILTLDNYKVHGTATNPMGGGLTGMAYSLAQGDHWFHVRNIDLCFEDFAHAQYRQALPKMIENEPPSYRGEVIKFRSGSRYGRAFSKLYQIPGECGQGIRTGGVYVIAGGSGTVGMVITRHLIKEYRAKVIWLGRTPGTSRTLQDKIASFAGLGDAPSHIRADVTQKASMKAAVQRIQKDHGKVHGAIFSAIVFNFNNSLAQTTEAEFKKILEVKTKGSLNFYEAFREEPLDFMCYFSSGQAFSFSGAGKLSAYAAGITFSDTFVQSIVKSAAFPVGIMNWGFWEASLKGASLGQDLGALAPGQGIECFEYFIQGLQKGLFNQLLCMAASTSVKNLMNISDEAMYTAPSNELPSIRILENSGNMGNEAGEPSQKGHILENLTQWFNRLLFAQLQQLGIFSKKEVLEKCSGLRKKAAIKDSNKRWWHESLNLLEQAGFIAQQVDRVKVCEDVAFEEHQVLWEQWNFQREKFLKDPDLKASVCLVEACLKHLPQILTGAVLATDILFPDNTLTKVAGIYKNSRQSDFFNCVVAGNVKNFIKDIIKTDSNAGIRILEIGAGTGGTTAMVLPELALFQDHITEYCYSDVSQAFLDHGRTSFKKAYPHVGFRLLNIEKPPTEQGMEVAAYDLVIAANVLHATRDIRKALGHVKSVLKRGGMIILNELSTKSLMSHLTFGLLKGWWRYQDPDLRIPGSPGLFSETWEKILEQAGFYPVLFPAKEAHHLGQQIIISKSNGVFKKKLSGPGGPGKADQKGQAGPDPRLHQNRQVYQQAQRLPGSKPKQYSGALKARLSSLITDCLSQTLKVPVTSLDPDTAFSDFGMDSVRAADFVGKIAGELGLDLNSAIVFEYANVNALAGFVMDTYGEILNKENPGHIQYLEKLNPPDLTREQDIKSSDILLRNSVAAAREKEAILPESSAIAVVGMSGQFPGASDVASFWQNLISGRDGMDCQKYQSKENDRNDPPLEGMLAQRDCFDSRFFKVSPWEARSMNPHQRLILQESWKSLEDAGYNPAGLSGLPVGIYVGAEPTGFINESFTGASDAIIASRLSYYLNLSGPAMVVNTGCSSSATAIHLACESLKNRETDLVLAGGVFAAMTLDMLNCLEGIEMLSKTGRCLTFDASADGTAFSEGVGVVVLKRLNQAIADNDHIYGVITGCGLNQDGASNGLTAPNGKAQEALIKNVYKRYGIHPEEITYMEAHGTATKLGDPVEANALVRAFKPFTSKKGYCAVGSAKSHIGHTSASAGVIALIKVLLSMQYGILPGMLHFKKLNPLIEFQDSPFYVNTHNQVWKSRKGRPLKAALNSFGHSGTNVHMVVEEYIRSEPAKKKKDIQPCAILLSAGNEDRLKAQASRLLEFVQTRHQALPAKSEGMELSQVGNPKEDDNPDNDSGIHIRDLAYTLQTGRDAMEERLGFVVQNIEQLERALKGFLGRDASGGQNTNVAFHRGRVDRYKDSLAVMTEDPDMEQAVCAWIKKGKYNKILSLWAKGIVVDWNRLYENRARPYKMSLPTYPFAPELHASDIKSPEGFAGLQDKKDVRSAKDFQIPEVLWDGMAYIPKWEAGPESLQDKIKINPKTVLMVSIGPPGNIEEALSNALGTDYPGARIIRIQMGDATQQAAKDIWYCHTSDPGGFQTCLKDLYLINQFFFISAHGKKDRLAESSESHEIQLLRLIKVLEQKMGDQEHVDSYILTRDTQQVTDEPTDASGAGLGGTAYALAQADHRFRVRLIDLSTRDFDSKEAGRALAGMILNEPPSQRGEGVKFQKGLRYQQQYFKLDWHRFDNNSGLKPGGVYVILGGSGSVGTVITRHLIRHLRARVIWMGRTPETDPAIIEKIASLGKLGDPPLYIQADATQKASIEKAVKIIKKDFPVINGAMFSGLVFDREYPLKNVTEPEFTMVLDVKTKGGIHFFKAFEKESLDFMCYFSSVQSFSFVSAKDSAAYAAGITFSDAFVRSLADAAFPVGMINWGFWEDTTKGTSLEERLGPHFGLISDQEGGKCLEKFTYLLQERILNQVIFIKASKNIRKLMNKENNEVITLCEQTHGSVIQSLWDENEN